MLKSADCIRVCGARTHNLQNVDIALPRDRLVVLTGPSGSGKSSLAFDTVYAEGQRQYIESLSPYARQFLHQLERPDVDLIEGLEPTISIDQRAGSHNPRSTVATVTEIYDYLRLLFARLGESSCHQCGMAIRPQSPEQIIETILAKPPGTRMMILAPIVRGRKGQHREALEEIRKAGFVRARIDGELLEVNEPPELSPRKAHTIEAVVDRIVIREGVEPRLAESVRVALRHGDGLVLATYEERNAAGEAEWRDELFSTLYSCPNCGISFEEIEPRTFSFNSPYGACPTCDGLGLTTRSVSEGIEARSASERVKAQRTSEIAAPPSRLRVGLVSPCPDCHGSRLRPEARAVRIAGRAIHEVTAANVLAAEAYFRALEFPNDRRPIADPITSEILSRLEFLNQVGLGYLTLDRPTESLSGGELQRVRLASGLGSGLVGVCYVLDEPSIGLHPRDNERLIQALESLRDRGNTVLVVEHDRGGHARAPDWLVDLGPGAGRHGGCIVAEGTPAEVAANPDSLTGRYLAGTEKIAMPVNRRPIAMPRAITIEGATTNNLKNVTATFPLSTFICVTGVSGSGKSSLLNDTLAPALFHRINGTGPNAGPHTSLRGASQIDKLIEIDQSPIGRSPRSNPATYTGIFDEIRKVFATVRYEARARGYRARPLQALTARAAVARSATAKGRSGSR